MLTKQEANGLFEYQDGMLYWKISKRGVKAGSKAGSVTHEGYMRVMVNGKEYKIHRLIFLMHHGYFPEMIDHINGNRSDNRIENLRPATNQQNQHNVIAPRTNTSGVKNVTWSKRNKKWCVELRVNGKHKNFGQYHDIDYAKFVANAMRYKYHGDFANHT